MQTETVQRSECNKFTFARSVGRSLAAHTNTRKRGTSLCVFRFASFHFYNIHFTVTCAQDSRAVLVSKMLGQRKTAHGQSNAKYKGPLLYYVCVCVSARLYVRISILYFIEMRI